MKYLIVLLVTRFLLANQDPNMIESKVQTDLDNLLSRLVSEDQFVLNVSAQVDTIPEKRLVEGETLSQNNSNTPSIPPLPGFQSEPSAQNPNPQSSRQTYKMVDKAVLTRLGVQLTFDERLSDELVKAGNKAVENYLNQNYPGKFNLSLNRLRLENKKTLSASTLIPWNSYLPWILLVLALSVALFRYFQKRQMQFQSQYPHASPIRSVYPINDNPIPETFSPPPKQLEPSIRKPVALPSGSQEKKGQFPALPATQEFVDQRSKLLQLFFGGSDRFRLYFNKLDPNAQLELYAGLRGPAFDSFLEGLGVLLPTGTEVTSPPSEEQMLFYEKNFIEFLQAQQWQSSQFFGFLQQLTNEQIVSLVKQQNSLVGALMIRFMKAEQSAFVLSVLTSKERVELLSQTDLINKTSTVELSAIEETVRNDVKKLPQYLSGSRYENIEFWSKILGQSTDQDSLLMDLEQTDPELYQSLSKFRFHLEDSPSLPKPLIEKVLSDTDNEELSMALLSAPISVRDYLLSLMVPKRKDLIQNHLLMLQGLENEKTKAAKLSLTKRFREVMA